MPFSLPCSCSLPLFPFFFLSISPTIEFSSILDIHILYYNPFTWIDEHVARQAGVYPDHVKPHRTQSARPCRKLHPTHDTTKQTTTTHLQRSVARLTSHTSDGGYEEGGKGRNAEEELHSHGASCSDIAIHIPGSGERILENMKY